MTRKCQHLILILMLVLAFTVGFAVTAHAQAPEPTVEATTPAPDVTPTAEVTPEPTVELPPEPLPDEPPVTTPGDILERLFVVLQGTYIAWAAAGVIIVTNLVKMIAAKLPVPFKFIFEGRSAVLLTTVIQVLIWLGYNVARYFGIADQFQGGYLAIIDVLKALLPLLLTFGVAHEVYSLAVRRGWPALIAYRPQKSTVQSITS